MLSLLWLGLIQSVEGLNRTKRLNLKRKREFLLPESLWIGSFIFFMTSFSEKLSFCLPGKISFLSSSHCWKFFKNKANQNRTSDRHCWCYANFKSACVFVSKITYCVLFLYTKGIDFYFSYGYSTIKSVIFYKNWKLLISLTSMLFYIF